MRAVCALTHTRAPVGEFDVSRRVFEREGGGPKDGCDALYDMMMYLRQESP